jgi:hypothetical protein
MSMGLASQCSAEVRDLYDQSLNFMLMPAREGKADRRPVA